MITLAGAINDNICKYQKFRGMNISIGEWDPSSRKNGTRDDNEAGIIRGEAMTVRSNQ
jgi:hypothetical protein